MSAGATDRADAPTNVAVVLAGGVGTRVGLDIPKQLIKIAGHTILEHTLAVLDAHPDVDEIVVMMAPGPPRRGARDRPRRRLHQGHATCSRAPTPATAPPMRALDVVEDDDAKVLLPRRRPPAGQRPDHQRVLRGAATVRRRRRRDPLGRHDHRGRRAQRDPRHPAAGQPAPRPDPAGLPGPRHPARRTPWPREDPDFQATDDCTVVLRYTPDVPIWVVAGEERNMKVTDPIDVYIADKLFQLTLQRPARRALRRAATARR